MAEQWSKYCEREGEATVKPVLVIQVEDGLKTPLLKQI